MPLPGGGGRSLLVLFLVLVAILQPTCSTTSEYSQKLTSKEHHRTQAAAERKNDLFCYRCDTIEHGDRCINITAENSTDLEHECKDDGRICLVKRFSYTTSTENTTSKPKVWGMERKCTNKCEPGCIVIGERTKLYACTSCCEKSLCNTGNGKSNDTIAKEIEIFFSLLLQILLTATLKPS